LEKHPVPAKTTITLHVNGVERKLAIAPWTTLLDALRLYLDIRKAATTANAAPAPFCSTDGASIRASRSRS
jgi:aerobic-type carbon monoxide dehydrogenase small subunit (CoxS/CutS family)